ncbi:MAG TPA: PilT/PilU family type 4a pilus ATPase, partial [Myxococcales bacterium]|nr:PilT/PilU family type 4a pilus ATPase [Myxococcales bacterium]
AEKDYPRHRARCFAFTRLVTRAPRPELFVPMVQALKVGDATLRSALAALLPVVNQVSEHGALCDLLRAGEAPVRQVAAQVLGLIGGKTALGLLTAWMEEPGFPGRIEALDAVARFAGHHAIPAFRGALLAGNPAEQAHALKYLGDPKYAGPGSGDALRIIAERLEREPNGRAQTITAFCRLCSEDDYFVAVAPFLDAEEPEVVKAAVEGLQRFPSARAVAALERRLRAGPNAIRLSIIGALEAMGTDDAVPALVGALGHSQASIRGRAGEALSGLSRAGKIDPARTIIWLAHSKDPAVRRRASDLVRSASASGQGDQLWARMLKLLRDTNWWVRESVAEVLAGMAGTQLTPHVLPLLGDPSDVVRRFAVELLMRLGDPRSLGPLIKVAVTDPDWWVRERAVAGAARLKDARAVPHLVRLLGDGEVRLACLEALAALDAKSAAGEIGALAGDGDPDVRLAVARCLAGFGDPALAGPLEALLSDGDPRVRDVARGAMSRWRPAQAAAAARSGPPIHALLQEMSRAGADDLLLAVGHPPTVKKMGRTTPLSEPPLTAARTRELLAPLLGKEQHRDLDKRGDTDFSYVADDLRFRVNAYQADGGLCAVFRIIRGKLLTFDQLGLPEVVRGLADLKNGLVVVGGPTGSGKSTTLAALIDHITRTRSQHIITLEDPVEVLYEPRKCLVNQREIGVHASSFSGALRGALRQDPDVLLVGEMRDLPTIAAAVTAAETGHLVFGTLHTVSVDTSVDRLINAFPAVQQDQVRAMLAESLRAVVCQYLLPRRDAPGRALALEVMLCNDAVSNLIRKGKTFQIPSVLASSGELGMRSMDSELMGLLKAGRISAEDAYAKARSKSDFEAALSKDGPAPLPPVAPLLGAAPPPSPRPAPPVLTPVPEPLPRRATPMAPMPAARATPVPAFTSDEEARRAWAAFDGAVEADKLVVMSAILAALERVIARDPGCASAHRYAGQVYLYAGDVERAQAWLAKAESLEAGPGQGTARPRRAAGR